MYKVLSIVFSLILLSSCSSDGGDSAPITPADTVFTLFGINVARPGTNESFSYSGNDNAGLAYTGTGSIADRGLTSFMSQSVRQTDIIISLTASNGGFLTSTGTIYGDPTTLAGVFEETDDGVICTATTILGIPDTAKPGDFGTLSSYTCSDGTTETGNWRLEASTNGLAKITYSFTYLDQFGNFSYDEESTFTIDTSGDVKASQLKLSDSTGYLLTLNGS